MSIWEYTKYEYPKLEEDIEVDILIIGGGITGISSLYHLKDTNLKVALVEQNKIGHGVTLNSTGKLTYLQNDLLYKIKNNFGVDILNKYIDSQIDGINEIVNTIEKENIDCDLEKVNSTLYTNKENEISKLKELERILNNRGLKTHKSNNELVESKYMFDTESTYIFHPVKFIHGLVNNNSPIYENTSIKRIKKQNDYYICYTDNHEIKTKWVIIASHYPYFQIPFLFPIKGSLEKSYISASIYKSNPISSISYSNPFISIRTHKDYLIYLSNTHILSKKDNKDSYKNLENKLKKLNLKPDYLWTNIDIMSNDSIPYIGLIKENMLIATAYNTWGLTNGFLAGHILSDIILNKKNKYIELFDPKRKNIYKTIKIFKCACETIEGYVKGLITKNDNISYDKVNNTKVLIYSNNIVNRKCPHFGCYLIFNEEEKTWDCPCHGSRFSLSGKCISGPSNHNISL